MEKKVINKFFDAQVGNIALINAWNLAEIFYKLDLGIKTQLRIVDFLCQQEKEKVICPYKDNPKSLIYDVTYCNQYLENARAVEEEVKLLERDLGKTLQLPEDFSANRFLNLYFFFKLTYIKLVIKNLQEEGNNGYVRVKYSRLLKLCNVQRRTRNVVEKIEAARAFYGFRLIGNRKEIVDLSSFPIDKYITFSLVECH